MTRVGRNDSYHVPCPVCAAETDWVVSDGLPCLAVQSNCNCYWNEHDWIVVLELAKDLAPLSENLKDECLVCYWPAPNHDEELHQELERKQEQMDRSKRREDAAARGNAVFIFEHSNGKKYYKVRAMVPESVLRKCNGRRKLHREAIPAAATVLVGSWSPLVIVKGEDDEE